MRDSRSIGPLDIEQDGAYDCQSRSLTTEEELVKIGRFTEHLQVLLAH